MPNVTKMEEVFEQAIAKFESSNRRLINTYSGDAGRQLDHEREVLKQDVAALRMHFKAAKNEA